MTPQELAAHLLAEIYLVNDADRAAFRLGARTNGRFLARYGLRVRPLPIYARALSNWLWLAAVVVPIATECCK